ncbi:DEAD-domain-containing protein [Byssothecium circinans]|uniref:RNA helicase n=1 Tax=Byssothecium circinans TaxID=147558 RepID=A0A6A5TJ39_9PLEO|nr:DEAD-domain-containing protein [Byssothecium circinans]
MAPNVDDFVFTISDNDEVSDDGALPKLAGQGKKRKLESPVLDMKQHIAPKKAKKNKKGKQSTPKQPTPESDAEDEAPNDIADPGEDVEGNHDIASDFEFTVGEDTGFIEDFDGWGNDMITRVQEGEAPGSAVGDIGDIVERRNKKKALAAEQAGPEEISDNAQDEDFEGFGDDDDELLADDAFGMGAESEGEDDSAAEDDSDDGSGEQASDDDEAAPVPHPMDLEAETSDESEDETPAEAEKAAAFFAPEEFNSTKKDKKKNARGATGSFQTMNISRPILRNLTNIGFVEPTPIQVKTIPIAIQGKDVVGGAETGSGKTAAFLLPILERLLHRSKKIPTTRVAIFMPTRELAVQCFNVAQKLGENTGITFALLAGGFSSREQEAVLKTKPDVVIATPGRFIDHMHNSAGFQVESLEILVLDEADRMLEEGFESQLTEILNTIPKSRQTMLFSATMTSSVDKLIQIGMTRPVRLMVNAKKKTVSGLTQEFVRLRHGKEDKRLAYLMYICTKVHTDRVIIFFRQKKEAHRVRVVFALCGIQASELHGNMTQQQRIQSVEAFRSGKSSYLLATDVASRGLDIKNVSTVINYEAPQTHEIYLHRVGRTARAGRVGRSCTIAAEPDRKIVKQAVKTARAQKAKVVSRQVPQEETDRWTKKLKELETEIEEVLAEEKEERAMSITERDLKRGENLIAHEDEIKSRPRRTWFESEKDKLAAKEKGLAELNGPKQKKKKLSGKDRKQLELNDVRKEGRVWKKGKEQRGLKTINPKDAKQQKDKGKNKGKKAGKGPKR